MPNPVIRFARDWFRPRATEPAVAFRERGLRLFIVLMVLLRPAGIYETYIHQDARLPEPMGVGTVLVLYAVPLLASLVALLRGRVNFAVFAFMAFWFFTDLTSMMAQGYWFSNFQVSLILQIIVASFLLPLWGLVPFVALQALIVVGMAAWLDGTWYSPPLLADGRPLTTLYDAMAILYGQAALALLLVYLLRYEVEKRLRLQRETIEDLEVRVASRTAELEQRNTELEAFSYSVSHDLRAPLRAINGYARILREDFAGILPDEAKGYLQRIEASSSRLGQLIHELLGFARLGRQALQVQATDLQALVQAAIAGFDTDAAGSNVEWLVHPLPVVQADPLLLEQVFANLLGNAVKYSGRCAAPRIEIGCLEEQGGPAFFVRDNGAGFDMRHADRLFGVFQRLHNASEFEGTGIGLATVHRIVTRHGGRIWAESELGKGATFYFTLA